ncbi:MAG: RDD family protein [Phycisphaerales bacterium]
MMIRAFLVSLLISLIARAADPMPAAGSVASVATPNHAWFVLRSDGLAPWVLMHVTPRAFDDTAFAGSVPGKARFASPIESLPMALAAVDASVYMMFDEDTPSSAGFRRIYRVTAVRQAGTGVWTTQPAGRFEQVGVQPVPGDLLAFFGTKLGPMALIRSAEAASAWVLVNDRWREVVLDRDFESSLRTQRLIGAASFGDISEVILQGDSTQVWKIDLILPEPTGADSSTIFDAPGGELPLGMSVEHIDAPTIAKNEITVLHLDAASRYLSVRGDGDGLRVLRFDPQLGWKQLSQFAGVPARSGFALLTDARRGIALWTREVPGEIAQRCSLEFRLDTGEILHDGPLKQGGPVSSSDYRLMVGAMLVIMISVLAYILRPEDKQVFNLPYGYSLAPVSRRFAAGLLDMLLSFAVARFVFRFLGDDGGSEALYPLADVTLGAMLCNFVLGVVGEARGGLTPGKMLAGLRVIRVIPDGNGDFIGEPPGLARAFLRNLMKWAAFPLAIMGTLSTEGRGRPDQFAGTVVVVPEAVDENLD